jgi:hypothetical protein
LHGDHGVVHVVSTKYIRKRRIAMSHPHQLVNFFILLVFTISLYLISKNAWIGIGVDAQPGLGPGGRQPSVQPPQGQMVGPNLAPGPPGNVLFTGTGTNPYYGGSKSLFISTFSINK